jgi:hypothetical protein
MDGDGEMEDGEGRDSEDWMAGLDGAEAADEE